MIHTWNKMMSISVIGFSYCNVISFLLQGEAGPTGPMGAMGPMVCINLICDFFAFQMILRECLNEKKDTENMLAGEIILITS